MVISGEMGWGGIGGAVIWEWLCSFWGKDKLFYDWCYHLV
jgi:hypothetical protein